MDDRGKKKTCAMVKHKIQTGKFRHPLIYLFIYLFLREKFRHPVLTFISPINHE